MLTHSGWVKGSFGGDSLDNRSHTAKQESDSAEQPDPQRAASLNLGRDAASPSTPMGISTAPCALAQVLGLKLTLQQSIKNKPQEFICNRG